MMSTPNQHPSTLNLKEEKIMKLALTGKLILLEVEHDEYLK